MGSGLACGTVVPFNNGSSCSHQLGPVTFHTTMSDTTPWEEYCEASLDLSNQDNVGDPQAPLDPELLMGANSI